MYYTYILWSSKLNKRYVGSTENIEKRLKEHNRGSNKFTKGGMPWILIYKENHQSKIEALKRENFLKSGTGRKWLDEKLTEINSRIRRGAGVVFSQRLIRLRRKLAR